MPTFASYDGTEIGYRVLGDGPPLVCLPGGPGRATEYLGDLGGLSASRRLVLADPRGVGLSADPADPATFAVDRLVQDVAALRAHLGLDRMDLLGHSAGAELATLYAAAFPQRLSALILVTPGLAAAGAEEVTDEQLRAGLARRSGEPWYPEALAAMEKLMAGEASMAAYRASRPFYYARWDDAARAHATAGVSERHQAAREGFFAGALDPPATVTALTKLTAPVLLYAGELDPLVPPAAVREAAPVFRNASVAVQPEAGHFPWIDGPDAFAAAISSFLRSAAGEHAAPPQG